MAPVKIKVFENKHFYDFNTNFNSLIHTKIKKTRKTEIKM